MILAQNIFEHVLDSSHWHVLETMDVGWHLPYGLTKYKVLLVLAALVIVAIYVPLARRVQNGDAPRGYFWNTFEVLLAYIRNEIAKPYIGHDADKYVSFLWTTFLFILVCNIFGMIPLLGSPTASLSVTLALAIVTFFFIHFNAIRTMGFGHYVQSLVPHLDLPIAAKIPILLILFPIEAAGHVLRAVILAIRLFANIFAGHLVLSTLMMFIVMVSYSGPQLFWPVSITTVIGVAALSLLELFVAFLQAYVFTFLTALFLGMTLHPEH